MYMYICVRQICWYKYIYRGSARRGIVHEGAIKNNMGDVELQDQILCIETYAKKNKNNLSNIVDLKKVKIYMCTCVCLSVYICICRHVRSNSSYWDRCEKNKNNLCNIVDLKKVCLDKSNCVYVSMCMFIKIYLYMYVDIWDQILAIEMYTRKDNKNILSIFYLIL
jgi:hypothetical protein